MTDKDQDQTGKKPWRTPTVTDRVLGKDAFNITTDTGTHYLSQANGSATDALTAAIRAGSPQFAAAVSKSLAARAQDDARATKLNENPAGGYCDAEDARRKKTNENPSVKKSR